jgi:glutaredoxin
MSTTIIVFTSANCAPCTSTKTLLASPTLADAMRDKKVEYIDVDTDPITSCKYGVRSVPTIFHVDTNGGVINRRNGGFSNKAEVESFLAAN